MSTDTRSRGDHFSLVVAPLPPSTRWRCVLRDGREHDVPLPRYLLIAVDPILYRQVLYVPP